MISNNVKLLIEQGFFEDKELLGYTKALNEPFITECKEKYKLTEWANVQIRNRNICRQSPPLDRVGSV